MHVYRRLMPDVRSLSENVLVCSTRVTSCHQRRGITGKMVDGKFMKAEIVRKTGKNLLSDPLFNKGLGFPRTERDRLGIRGLVPPST